MSWYRKTFVKISRRVHEHEFSYGGVNFTGEISGKYRPATQIDPPEYPEVEIVGAEIEDYEELIEVFSNEDVIKINNQIAAEVNLRASHFGATDDPFIVKFNGLTMVIKVPRELQLPNTYITDWTIANAIIDKPKAFLDSISGETIEHVKSAMLENYLEGSYNE